MPSTASSTTQRWWIENRSIRSSIGVALTWSEALVIVARPGLAQLGLKHEAAAGCVPVAGREAFHYLDPCAVVATELHWAHLEELPCAQEHDLLVAIGLQRVGGNRDGDFGLVLDHIHGNEQPGTPTLIRVAERDASLGRAGL